MDRDEAAHVITGEDRAAAHAMINGQQCEFNSGDDWIAYRFYDGRFEWFTGEEWRTSVRLPSGKWHINEPQVTAQKFIPRLLCEPTTTRTEAPQKPALPDPAEGCELWEVRVDEVLAPPLLIWVYPPAQRERGLLLEQLISVPGWTGAAFWPREDGEGWLRLTIGNNFRVRGEPPRYVEMLKEA